MIKDLNVTLFCAMSVCTSYCDYMKQCLQACNMFLNISNVEILFEKLPQLLTVCMKLSGQYPALKHSKHNDTITLY